MQGDAPTRRKPRWKVVVELLLGVAWATFTFGWFAAVLSSGDSGWLILGWLVVTVVNLYTAFALIRSNWKIL